MATLTGYKRDIDGLYIDKDPESVLKYTIDWSNWLASGESIVASRSIDINSTPTTFTTDVTPETISGDADPLVCETFIIHNNAKQIIMTLHGGTAGNIYKVTNRIVTDEDEVCEKFFRIVVKDRSL